MTPEERAKLEAKVFGDGGAPAPAPAAPAAAAAPPDRQTLERQVGVAAPSADMDSAANAAGYGFIDKATLGFLPYLRDKIADLAGNTTQLRRDEQRAHDESAHPVASTAGGAAGTILPAVAGAGLAGAAGVGNAAVRGAIGYGGANVADQAARAAEDQRPFDPYEAILATAGGAIGNPVQAAKLAATAAHPIAAAGGWALRKGIQTLIGKAEQAGATAARSPGAILDDIEKMAATVGPKPPAAPAAPAPAAPRPPPPESLAGYAADDPIAEVSRLAREQARQARMQPGWTPDIGPVGPRPPPAAGFRPSQIKPTGSEDIFAEALRSGRKMPLPEELVAATAPPVAPPPAPPPGLLNVTGRQLAWPALTQEASSTLRGEDQDEKKRRRQAGRGGRP